MTGEEKGICWSPPPPSPHPAPCQISLRASFAISDRETCSALLALREGGCIGGILGFLSSSHLLFLKGYGKKEVVGAEGEGGEKQNIPHKHLASYFIFIPRGYNRVRRTKKGAGLGRMGEGGE